MRPEAACEGVPLTPGFDLRLFSGERSGDAQPGRARQLVPLLLGIPFSIPSRGSVGGKIPSVRASS